MLNINTPHQCTKEEFVLWAVWQILRVFLTLTLDFKVISIFWNFVVIFTWYTIFAANMNMHGQKNERGVRVLSVFRQVLSISDLDLWLPDHISDVKHLFYSRHYEQPLCNLESMLYLKSPMHVTHPKIWKIIIKKPWFCGQITLKIITMETILHNFLITI